MTHTVELRTRFAKVETQWVSDGENHLKVRYHDNKSDTVHAPKSFTIADGEHMLVTAGAFFHGERIVDKVLGDSRVWSIIHAATYKSDAAVWLREDRISGLVAASAGVGPFGRQGTPGGIATLKEGVLTLVRHARAQQPNPKIFRSMIEVSG